MDEAGEHHSQQTDTGSENQTPHVLLSKWELNHETTLTQEGEQHTLGTAAGVVRGNGRENTRTNS